MNPFDIRTALLAKHAQHVVLIHFPIALFIAGVIFDFLAQSAKRRALAAVAYYNLLGAAISVVPAVITGLLAWQIQLEGQKLKGILLMHLVLGSPRRSLFGLFGGSICGQRQSNGRLPVFRLGLETLAVMAIALTAHLGGFLSGVNGPN